MTRIANLYSARCLGQPSDYVDENGPNDLDFHTPTWTEAVKLAENRPLWMLLATGGTMHS